MNFVNEFFAQSLETSPYKWITAAQQDWSPHQISAVY